MIIIIIRYHEQITVDCIAELYSDSYLVHLVYLAYLAVDYYCYFLHTHTHRTLSTLVT